MKTTGIFTTTFYTIPFNKYGDKISIIPFGDIHRSSPQCHADKWLDDLKKMRSIKNAFFIGMGDYDDLMSTSERDVINNGRLHDSTRKTLEDGYMKFTQRLAKEMDFMKGRIIGLVEGNHYSTFSWGQTTTQYLCQLLGCKYLGVSAFIRIRFSYDKHHTHAYTIWAHHGLGGGRTTGASINKLETMLKVAVADCYLMGHDHRKSIAFLNILDLSDTRMGKEPILINKKIVMARTGSYLKGYVANEPTYIADAAMNPSDLGHVRIEITPMRKHLTHADERWLEVNGQI